MNYSIINGEDKEIQKYATRFERLKKIYEQAQQNGFPVQDQILKVNLSQLKMDTISQLYQRILQSHHIHNSTASSKLKNMDNSELELLEIIVFLYCNQQQVSPLLLDVYDWDQIGIILFNRHWKVCRSKFMESRAASVIGHPWTREEDKVLEDLYNNYAQQKKYNKWSQIAIDLSRLCKTCYVRLGKQCRERWINKLDPLVERGPWYKEDEVKLMQAVQNFGKKWSLICKKHFSNQRTENSIKNRYHTILKRESSKFEYQSETKQNANICEYREDSELISKIIDTLKEEAESYKYFFKNKKQENSSEEIVQRGLFQYMYNETFFKVIDDTFHLVVIKKKKLNPL